MSLLVLAGCGAPSVNSPTSTAPLVGPPAPSNVTSGAPAGGTGWQLISNFPIDGASQVNAVVARRDGFVAVGTVSDDSATCIADQNNGHVWSTTDGQTWVPEPPDPFAQTDLTNLVTFKDSIYAFGFVGAFGEEAGSECSPGPNPTGVNVWRSGDGGANWEHLQQSAAISQATIDDVTAAGDQLVLVGSQTDSQGNDAAGSWSSPDGVVWTPAVLPPATSSLGTVAAHDNVIVGFGFDSNFPLPWITRDAGGHWYEESVDVPGAQSNANGDVGISIEDVLATAAGYVAVGDTCCSGTAQIMPLSVSTPDGTQWKGGAVPVDTPQAMRLVGQLPAGLLAIGVRTYIDETPPVSELGGRSWTSPDGNTWTPGPAFADLGDGNVTAMAVGSKGVVVAGTTFVDSPAPGGDTGLRVWYGPLSAFEGGTSN